MPRRRAAAMAASLSFKKVLAWLKPRVLARQVHVIERDSASSGQGAGPAFAAKPAFCGSPVEVLELAGRSTSGTATLATESSDAFRVNTRGVENPRVSSAWCSLATAEPAPTVGGLGDCCMQALSTQCRRSFSSAEKSATDHAAVASGPATGVVERLFLCGSRPAAQDTAFSKAARGAGTSHDGGLAPGLNLGQATRRGCSPSSPAKHPDGHAAAAAAAPVAVPMTDAPSWEIAEPVDPLSLMAALSPRAVPAGPPIAFSGVMSPYAGNAPSPPWGEANGPGFSLAQVQPCGVFTLLCGGGLLEPKSCGDWGAVDAAGRAAAATGPVPAVPHHHGPLLDIVAGPHGYNLYDELDPDADMDLVLLSGARTCCRAATTAAVRHCSAAAGAPAGGVAVDLWADLVNGVAPAAAREARTPAGAGEGPSGLFGSFPLEVLGASLFWQQQASREQRRAQEAVQAQRQCPDPVGLQDTADEDLSEVFGTLGRIYDDLAARAAGGAAAAATAAVATADGAVGGLAAEMVRLARLRGDYGAERAGTLVFEMLLTFGEPRDGEEGCRHTDFTELQPMQLCCGDAQ